MTYREAVAQAHRETGMTEESIKRCLQYADLNCPSETTRREIPKGQERVVIDHFKQQFAALERLTDEEKQRFREAIHAARDQLSKGN